MRSTVSSGLNAAKLMLLPGPVAQLLQRLAGVIIGPPHPGDPHSGHRVPGHRDDALAIRAETGRADRPRVLEGARLLPTPTGPPHTRAVPSREAVTMSWPSG